MAIASDGSLLVNAHGLTGADDIQAVVEAALKHGGRVFVGVAMDATDLRSAMRRIDDAAAEIAARVRASSPRATPAARQPTTADAGQVAAYVDALRVQHTATTERRREAGAKKVASIWFVMDIETQKAATVEAARAGLLEPREGRNGKKHYPLVRDGRVVWVTVPGRET